MSRVTGRKAPAPKTKAPAKPTDVKATTKAKDRIEFPRANWKDPVQLNESITRAKDRLGLSEHPRFRWAKPDAIPSQSSRPPVVARYGVIRPPVETKPQPTTRPAFKLGIDGVGRLMTKVERVHAPDSKPARAKRASEKPKFAYSERLKDCRRTAYAVWEITLKCNLACTHCGSRAGDAREGELSTDEALDLVRQLADAGITEVSLIGGEAFLRPDWLVIARAIADAGMIPTMVTGGYGVSRATAQKMVEAGIAQVSISLDGLEKTHDELRGKPGSYFQALKTAKHFREVGLGFGFNTQVNRRSAPELPRLYEVMRDAGANGWQFSLTVPMGNAADRPELLMQPVELLELFPVLARVTWRADREGVRVIPGNDIGFFGPYEEILREEQFRLGAFWQDCQAGLGALGIEEDGKVKGCPSLPTDSFVGGNIRDMSLQDILKTKELTFNLEVGGTPEGAKPLWGFCKTCEFAELCRGGCTWTAHVFFDKPGNNPHCHHRALTLKQRGRRERVRLKEKAEGVPFDNGVCELVEEPFDAPWPEGDALRFTAASVVWSESWNDWPEF